MGLWLFASKQKTNPQKENSEIMARHASLFSQLLAFFNRNKFNNLVMKHNTKKYSKGFKSWDQFVAMLFCQLAQAKSLREISGALPAAWVNCVILGSLTYPPIYPFL